MEKVFVTMTDNKRLVKYMRKCKKIRRKKEDKKILVKISVGRKEQNKKIDEKKENKKLTRKGKMRGEKKIFKK